MNPPRKIALYGGTFDPVHLGHLAVARAALRRFLLNRVYFVPAGVQPLKAGLPVTSFHHRYAMLALALQAEPQFVPSLLESPEILGSSVSYTVDTIARARARLEPGTELYFLIGMDAFRIIARWRSPVELLRSAQFIVASRPGFPLDEVIEALPEELRPAEADARRMLAEGCIRHNGAAVHLLPQLAEEASATAIREAARSGHGLELLVPAAVAAYIAKLRLYISEDPGQQEPGAPEPA